MRSLLIAGGCLRRTNISAYDENTLYFGCSNSLMTCHSIYMFPNSGDFTCLFKCPEALIIGDDSGNIFLLSEKEYEAQVGIGVESYKICSEPFKCTVQKIGENIFSEIKLDIQKFVLKSKIYFVSLINDKIIIFDSFMISAVESFNTLTFLGDIFGNLKIYEKDKLVLETKAHEDTIRDIKVKGFGSKTFLATCSQDKLIKVWEVFAENQTIQINKVDVLEGHEDFVMSLKWLGSHIVSSSLDNSILVWKKEDRWNNVKRLGSFNEKNRAFYNAIALNGVLKSTNPCLEFESTVKEEDKVMSIIGQSYTGGFYLYINDKIFPYISGHLGEINSIDWNKDFILTSSSDKTSRIFHNGREIARVLEHGYSINTSKWLFKEAFEDKIETIKTEDSYFKRFCIIVGSQETIIRIMEPTKLFLASQGFRGGKVFNSINSELSLTNEDREDGSLGTNEWTLSNNRFTEAKKTYGHYFEVSTIAVSSDRIFTANKSSNYNFSGIFIWDKDMNKVNYFKCHDLGINMIRVSNCNKRLLAASRDKTISLYKILQDKNDLELIKRISDHKRSVFDCGFNYDSSIFASVSRDKRVLIYNFVPELVYEKKYDCEVTCMSFSKKSNVLCVGLEDGCIEILDVDSKTSRRAKIHGKRVSAIEFNEDNLLATGSLDGILRVFQI